MTIWEKYTEQKEQQVQRPKGRIVLEDCEQDGDVEGPDVRPHVYGGELGHFLCDVDSLGWF